MSNLTDIFSDGLKPPTSSKLSPFLFHKKNLGSLFGMFFSPLKHGKRKMGRSKGMGNKSFQVSLEMVDFLLFLGPLI